MEEEFKSERKESASKEETVLCDKIEQQSKFYSINLYCKWGIQLLNVQVKW